MSERNDSSPAMEAALLQKSGNPKLQIYLSAEQYSQMDLAMRAVRECPPRGFHRLVDTRQRFKEFKVY